MKPEKKFDKTDYRRLAKVLDDAMLESREIERLTAQAPDLSLEDAYFIMDEGIALREARGEKITGLKMGLTSAAKRNQMNLHSPIYGVLTDKMRVEPPHFSLTGHIHPKIEPEIAFRVNKDIRKKLSLEEAAEACTEAAPALEILDSRFLNFKYFSLPDVVADNASSSKFVLGHFRTLRELGPLDTLQMRMLENGEAAQEALSKEISGHPLISVVQLSELLEARGKVLRAGQIVLAGAATQAIMLKPKQTIELLISGFDPLRVTVDS